MQIIARVLLILGAALGLAYVLAQTRRYELAVLLGGLLVYGFVSLIRYAEKTMRDLTRFLQAIRFADFSQGFVSGARGPMFDKLSQAFGEVVEEFKQVRAEKEEQVRYLQNVVRHVGVALVAFRADGSVELMNRAAQRLLETGPVRNLERLEVFSPALVQAMRGLGSGEQALVKVDRDGRTLQLSVYATRFRLRGAAHALVSIQDIGRELEDKEMEAWQQLTRVLTHEIMNSVAPISSLAGTARRLLSDGAAGGDGPSGEGASGTDDVREALRVIERRSDALVSFVDAYRSFTKIPAPDFQMIAAQDLLGGVTRLLGAQAEAVEVRVGVEPPGLQLTADPDLLEQVLINLVLNAVQAVEGQPDATVELRAWASAAHGTPVIEVADNGSGIAPAVQEKIFVPFFTTKEDGSGIGLSLARQIMRLHGGTIRVRSEPEQETVFTLRF